MKSLLDREDLVFGPPQLGCVLYLPGLPGGGSKTYDRSSYGNHGLITGATWVKLPSGLWCLSFDGTDDYVTTTTLPINWTSDDWSVLVWASLDSDASDAYRGIVGLRDGDHTQDFWTLGTPQMNYIKVEYWDGTFKYINVVTNPKGAGFRHYAVLHQGTNITVFVDGEQKASSSVGSADIGDTANTFYLAKWLSTNQVWDGHISLVRVCHRLLSWLEIQNHFNREKHLFGVW